MKKTFGEKAFNIINIVILLCVCTTTLFPFVHVIAKSLSSESQVLAKNVFLIPKGFHLDAYRYVLQLSQFYSSFYTSIVVTITGTLISMILTLATAFVLSRKNVPGKGGLTFLFVFTMMFSGGIIPTYLLVKNLGLIDNRWALILPVAVAPFNMIIMKNFFESIPYSLQESASIDGASYTRVLFTIYIPLSLAGIATISLFYAVGFWNNYMGALLYINDRAKYPLQLYLRDIIVDSGMDTQVMPQLNSLATETIRGATIVLATFPILMIYPFLQKHFAKGVMIGAVKG